MAALSGNTRRALRGHLWRLLDLLEKVRETSGAQASSSAHISYVRRPAGDELDHVQRFLEDFDKEVDRAAFQWGIDIEGEPIDARHALSVTLQFVGIAIDEMSPARLSGFGALDPVFETDYAAFIERLRAHLDAVQRSLDLR
ncbi:hypothetical protein [Paraburkholderia unamae]|uniref:Uncharacterized protein n=1 Tax=Paraburkholderia unamae TaxID=219649 RepID=A0ABX5KVK7_9BURK|nr:hypothetical protein [Paraburkholderia unamae]PVX85540.1 hypothetical protein C7402_103115 [Paraburkholderia unamae]RAR55251.1 hypothetical protein C7401_12228 [Paraburkholderia unamae]CAG9268049.1 conserved hypothetical protein [Paraburkholderia unamae]